jgi:uncharacterized protein (DUF2132 family)
MQNYDLLFTNTNKEYMNIFLNITDILSSTKYLSKTDHAHSMVSGILIEATTKNIIQYIHIQFFRRYYIQENISHFLSALVFKYSSLKQLQVQVA